jgi:hypothetical protein
MSLEPEHTLHQAAELFPQMSEAEYEALKADIAANGLREEIVTYEGQILDGSHRYRACLASHIEPRYREYEGDNPVNFVVSMNLHRRHLNPSQRAMIAAALANSKHGGDRTKAQICALNHAQAAKQFNVSERQVDKASALLKVSGQAAAIFVEQVRNGAISLNRAEKLVQLPEAQQHEVVVPSDVQAALQTKAAHEPREKWTRRFDQIISQTERLCSRIETLAARAEEAGELAPGPKERLVQMWRRSQWLWPCKITGCRLRKREGPS